MGGADLWFVCLLIYLFSLVQVATAEKMRLLLAVITLFTAIHLSTGGKMSSGLHSEKRPADAKDLVGKLLESSSAQHRERRDTSPSVNKAAEIEQRNDLEHVRRVRQTGGLDFGDLPTTVPAIESVIDISMGSVDGYFMLVRSFIDTVRPGPLPYGNYKHYLYWCEQLKCTASYPCRDNLTHHCSVGFPVHDER